MRGRALRVPDAVVRVVPRGIHENPRPVPEARTLAKRAARVGIVSGEVHERADPARPRPAVGKIRAAADAGALRVGSRGAACGAGVRLPPRTGLAHGHVHVVAGHVHERTASARPAVALPGVKDLVAVVARAVEQQARAEDRGALARASKPVVVVSGLVHEHAHAELTPPLRAGLRDVAVVAGAVPENADTAAAASLRGRAARAVDVVPGEVDHDGHGALGPRGRRERAFVRVVAAEVQDEEKRHLARSEHVPVVARAGDAHAAVLRLHLPAEPREVDPPRARDSGTQLSDGALHGAKRVERGFRHRSFVEAAGGLFHVGQLLASVGHDVHEIRAPARARRSRERHGAPGAGHALLRCRERREEPRDGSAEHRWQLLQLRGAAAEAAEHAREVRVADCGRRRPEIRHTRLHAQLV